MRLKGFLGYSITDFAAAQPLPMKLLVGLGFVIFAIVHPTMLRGQSSSNAQCEISYTAPLLGTQINFGSSSDFSFTTSHAQVIDFYYNGRNGNGFQESLDSLRVLYLRIDTITKKIDSLDYTWQNYSYPIYEGYQATSRGGRIILTSVPYDTDSLGNIQISLKGEEVAKFCYVGYWDLKRRMHSGEYEVIGEAGGHIPDSSKIDQFALRFKMTSSQIKQSVSRPEPSRWRVHDDVLEVSRSNSRIQLSNLVGEILYDSGSSQSETVHINLNRRRGYFLLRLGSSTLKLFIAP
jgi:hypothetical protein